MKQKLISSLLLFSLFFAIVYVIATRTKESVLHSGLKLTKETARVVSNPEVLNPPAKTAEALPLEHHNLEVKIKELKNAKKSFDQALKELQKLTNEINEHQGQHVSGDLEFEYQEMVQKTLAKHEQLLALTKEILSREGAKL